jgi:hypothetical protein
MPDNPTTVFFDPVFSSSMVLQQAPARSSIFGKLNSSNVPNGRATVVLTVIGSDDSRFEVMSDVTGLDWRTILPPMPSNEVVYTISAALGHRHDASSHHRRENIQTTLHDIVFGDVWLCVGQSNMERALKTTFDANATIAAARLGKYDNIRLKSGACIAPPLPPAVQAKYAGSLPPPSGPWLAARLAARANPGRVPELSHASAVCWYFAVALTERFFAMGRAPPTLGLVCAVRGGSYIEQWAPSGALDGCKNRLAPAPTGDLYAEILSPLARMSLKGFLWYQGEYNVILNAVSGSSLGRYGYGCELPALVRSWRAAWAKTPNTTAPDAPVGVVTLAENAHWHGGRDMGGMRHAQTANFGVLPNPLMPNTFLAQAYDISDPWTDKRCMAWGCCQRVQQKEHREGDSCANHTAPFGGPAVCQPACAANLGTTSSLGWIHPRLKRPIGERLATAAMGVVYGSNHGAATGPTLASCARHGGQLLLNFSRALLNGERVIVHKKAAGGQQLSLLQVLTKKDSFCLQPMQRCGGGRQSNTSSASQPRACKPTEREWFCPKALGYEYDPVSLQRGGLEDVVPVLGSNAAYMPPDNATWETDWVTVDIAESDHFTHQVVASLGAHLRDAPIHAVRYAWGVVSADTSEAHCSKVEDDALTGLSRPCEPVAPISASGGLPANPFLARVVNDHCVCIPPQECSGEVEEQNRDEDGAPHDHEGRFHHLHHTQLHTKPRSRS